MEKIRIRDPGWKTFGSGINIPIRDKHPGTATLDTSVVDQHHVYADPDPTLSVLMPIQIRIF
jgi:hypothetical protein